MSQKVQDALEADFDSELPPTGSRANRILALKLSAAAAVDIDVANRIAELDPEPENLDRAEQAFRDREVGTPLSRDELDEIAGLFETPEDLRDHEPDVVPHALFRDDLEPDPAHAVTRITHTAAVGSTDAVLGLVGVGALPPARHELATWAGREIASIFVELQDNSTTWATNRAVQLLEKGLNKLTAVLDRCGGGIARERALDLVEKGFHGQVVRVAERWLGGLYDVSDVMARKVAGGDRSHPAHRRLEKLVKDFDRQATILEWVLRVVGRARRWIIGISWPVGLIGLITGYLLATGFIVVMGAAYIGCTWVPNGFVPNVFAIAS